MHKSFLKWPGGKFRLLKHILPRIPHGVRLVEPFVGAGALALNAPFSSALLCDINTDLIAVYHQLQCNGEAFIARCKTLFTPHTNEKQCYLAFRDAFNQSCDAEERAMLFLYLNRHGFNGLVRYNKSGRFNVPFGRYVAPYFPEVELRRFVVQCQTCELHIAAQDFRTTFAALKPGDVVYADPPYAPLSASSNFTSYAGNTFGVKEQRDLAQLAVQTAQRGIPVLMSNHHTPLTEELYAQAQAVDIVPVQRSISCKGAQRCKVNEVLALFNK